MIPRFLLIVAVSFGSFGCASARRQREIEQDYARRENANFARLAAGAGNFRSAPKEIRGQFDALFPGASAMVHGGVKEGQKVVAPRILSAPHPRYPLHYRIYPREGRVWVGFVVGLDGKVESARALHDPDDLFSLAAVKGVKRWRFSPVTIDGQPRKMSFIVPIRFALAP